jgi:hypothetical protein
VVSCTLIERKHMLLRGMFVESLPEVHLRLGLAAAFIALELVLKRLRLLDRLAAVVRVLLRFLIDL